MKRAVPVMLAVIAAVALIFGVVSTVSGSNNRRELEGRMEVLQTRVETEQAAAAELKETAEAEAGEAAAALAEARQEAADARAEAAELATRVEELTGAAETAKAEAGEAAAALAGARQEAADAKAEAAEQKNRAEELTTRVEELSEELKAAERALSAARGNAFLLYVNGDGSVQSLGTADSEDGLVTVHPAEVKGPGIYSVSLEFARPVRGLSRAALAILNGEKLYPGYRIDVREIRVNGEKIDFTEGYTCAGENSMTVTHLYNREIRGLPAGIRDRAGTVASSVMVSSSAFGSVRRIEVLFRYGPAEKQGETAEKGLKNP